GLCHMAVEISNRCRTPIVQLMSNRLSNCDFTVCQGLWQTRPDRRFARMQEPCWPVPACPHFRRDGHRRAEGTRHLRPVPMLRPLDIELRLLPLDDTRVDTLPTRSQRGSCKILQQSLIAAWHLVGIN